MRIKGTFLFMLITLSGFSQIPYHDAIELKKLLKNGVLPNPKPSCATAGKAQRPDCRTWAILKHYSNVNNNDYNVVYKDYKLNNPFIGSFVGNLSAAGTGSKPLKLSDAVSSISGLDVTSIATGFSQFLIERANEEINIAFFNKFKKFLSENEEAATLFPNTTNFISNSEPYQYALLLQTFKEAFKEDITNLVSNIGGLLELPRYNQFGQKHPEAYAGLAAASAVSQLANGGNVADVIKKLGEFKNLEKIAVEKKNLYSAIKLMSVLSESVRSNTDEQAWVSASDFRTKIINDSITFKIYLGMIYQISEGIEFKINDSTPISFQQVLKDANKAKNDFKDILKYFKSIEDKWSSIKALQETIKTKKDKNEKVEYTEYYNFFNANIGMIETLLDVNTVLTGLGASCKIKELKETREYLSVLKTGNKIYKNISEKNYSSAVMNFVIVYDNIIGSRINEINKTSKADMKSVLSSKNISYGNSNVKKRYKDSIQIGIPKVDFLKYATFMAAMVEAENPEAVKSIIKAAALPAGSSSIKKNSSFNISLQSYVGVYLRTDVGKNSIKNNAWDHKFGVIAPFGVSFNIGLGKVGSIGLFTSFIDVGAIVDYEIKTDSTSSIEYKIELGQIFSPGVYAVYGFGFNIPLTFGVGCQYGPGLIEIKDSMTTVVNNPSVRLNIFLAFDIPIITFHNRGRNGYPKNKKSGK